MNFNQKTTKPFITLCIAGFLLSAFPDQAKAEELVRIIEISNEWETDKTDEPVVICLGEINPSFRVRSATVWDGTNEIPSQLDDLDGDRKADELACQRHGQICKRDSRCRNLPAIGADQRRIAGCGELPVCNRGRRKKFFYIPHHVYFDERNVRL